MKASGLGLVRILVAEDNAPDVFLVREALSEAGIEFELLVAKDGEKAIALIEEIDNDPESARPDLLLLDLNLPRASGGDMLRRARQSTWCGKVPIVVMTSSDLPEDRATALQLGATAYFQKPSNLDEFLKLGDLVQNVLQKRRSALPD
jgi:CheY-like chemotaxis protein